MKDFKAFIFRGNLVDLAVGIAIGVAFTTLVKGLVQDMITPIVTAITGTVSFQALTFTIHHSQFFYGAFISTLLAFGITAAAIFFFVVKPTAYFLRRTGHLKDDAKMKDCPECTTSIPEAARRCPQCTAVIVEA